MYTWDSGIGRYRDRSTGRLVPIAQVRAAIDAAADQASAQLASLTARLARGEILLSEWQVASMRVVKVAHVACAVIARGGREQMTPSDWGFAGSRIRAEYGYLRSFAAGIADGTVAIDGRTAVRAAMYGQAARVTYTDVFARDQRGRGYQSERNVLGAAEHCAECSALSARGWAPIGTLPPPGSRQCLSNCRCRLAYSRVAAEAA